MAFIRQRGHEVTDVGSYDPAPVDFPDIAAKVAASITGGQAERGLMVCGTGACPEASEGWAPRSAPTR